MIILEFQKLQMFQGSEGEDLNFIKMNVRTQMKNIAF